jgi:(S)-citramalyl-CoA lyase
MSPRPLAPRSLLFAPATRPDRLRKATAGQADIVCADLEDAVSPAEKDTARPIGIDFLGEHNDRCLHALRINPLNTADGLRDMLALLAGNPRGLLCLPKVRSAAELVLVDELLASRPELTFVPFIEYAAGLENAVEIAHAPRVAWHL